MRINIEEYAAKNGGYPGDMQALQEYINSKEKPLRGKGKAYYLSNGRKYILAVCSRGFIWESSEFNTGIGGDE